MSTGQIRQVTDLIRLHKDEERSPAGGGGSGSS